MKKKIIFGAIALIYAIGLSAEECKIISSPAMNKQNVVGTDAVALSISRFYYDENKKMKIKSYSDAFLEFHNKAIKYIKGECVKYKIKNIYNFQTHQLLEENHYHFNATYDFSRVN